ncbi:MAG: class A beta-lactamase [Pseudonocardiales bacterium]|nr:class A beta-lactamase [Pseudonocardiales bacterium]
MEGRCAGLCHDGIDEQMTSFGAAPGGPDRRSLLIGLAAAPALIACGYSGPSRAEPAHPTMSAALAELSRLETGYAGRIGVYGLDTGSGAELGYRAQERFAMCSTFKMLAVAAILQRHRSDSGLLDRLVRYDRSSVIANSPVAAEHVAEGLTVSALCEAAITYSDNTAANELLRILGGPGAVTAFARTLGDGVTRLDRWEPEMSMVPPGDQRDTSTPAMMAVDLRALTLANALDPARRDQLTTWLLANTTGATRIRAGLPASWRVGDKTGTGFRTELNDLAIVWPPRRAPLIISIYTVRTDPTASPDHHVLAAAAAIVARAFTPAS